MPILTLVVREKEVLGIAGVSGNGQTQLAQVLSGTRKPSAGKIYIGEKDLTGATPAQFTSAMVGRIPEDRHGGIVSELNVAENLALETLDQFTKGGFLDKKAILQNAAKLL